MATVIPLNNTAFTTAGERRFYIFLRDVVKPDSQCLAWYSPSVDGREPDFILYTPEEGLIVFEVKDWKLDKILAMDVHTVTLALPEEGREESCKNPLQQGRDYVFALMDRIKASCKQLLSTEPRYQGKPKLPVQYGLVFTNITRAEFCAKSLDKVIPLSKALFSDDLALAAVQSDNTVFSQIREQLAGMFSPPFSFRLSERDIAALRELLWPQVRILLPERAGKPSSREKSAAELRLLDTQQESIACRLDAAQAIIEGPAGSGKSLVLMAKAIQTYTRLRQNGIALPVLVVCFNLTLVHYLKRLLAGHNARLGRKDIQVTHYYEFCRFLLSEPLIYEKEDGDYYELVTRMAFDAASDGPRYGAIFVDEGQDFSDNMLAVLQQCLTPEGMLWIALDTAQELYDIPRTWLNNKNLQRFFLRNPYRATLKLTAFCESLAGHRTPEMQTRVPFSERSPAHNFEGEPPQFTQIADASQGAKYIVERIRYLHSQGVPYSEIMLLYASRRYGGLEGDFPPFLLNVLEENGILASWPARDAQSKAGWDITTDSVTISTIHSMKGMDAEAVFVIGLDTLKEEHASASKDLAYVACSRARCFLDILYMEETSFISYMMRRMQERFS